MVRIVVTSLLAGTALAGALGLTASPSYAYGNAPWCAMIELGTGDVYWDCQYTTIEECVPNVLAGNRGFCNPNPNPGPPAAPGPRYRHHPARHHAPPR